MTRPKTSNGELSELSQLVLEAHRNNPSATLNELAEATGYSRTAVYYHLNNLQAQGVVICVRRERAAKQPKEQSRKQTSKKTAKKVNESFNAGNAFHTNSTNSVRDAEQKRIDKVVEDAERNEASGVVPAGANIFFDHRVRRVLGRKAG